MKQLLFLAMKQTVVENEYCSKNIKQEKGMHQIVEDVSARDERFRVVTYRDERRLRYAMLLGATV